MIFSRSFSRSTLFGLLVLAAAPALAHVKWFSQSADLQDIPLSLTQILTPTFYALAALSLVVVVALALADDPIQKFGPYLKLRAFFQEREEHAGRVMRIATGMALLLSWQANVLLAPDLHHELALVSWAQFIAILCLIDRRTTPVAGALVFALYGVGIYLFGIFHMLDYAAFLGVGFYLLFREQQNERLRAWVKPVLFGTTGLSLAWLALEKLVYPTWGLVLLEQNPVLGLNLPPQFFLTAAAFIEFSLGFLLLIGVMGRPLSVVITLVFFLTTMVFGKEEVVGHLVLHGVLIVFMLEGTSGKLVPPFRFHRSLPLRVAFVGVNFALLLAVLLVGYLQLASPRQVTPVASHGAMAEQDAPSLTLPPEQAPVVSLRATPAENGGWVLDLELERFRISSKGKSAAAPADGTLEGHAHLFVNGKLKGMIFSNRHELKPLPPGQHTLMVQLSTPDHQALIVNGAPVEGSVTVVAPSSAVPES